MYNSEKNKGKNKFVGFFSQILLDSNLHGVKYIVLADRHIVERVFWGIAILSFVIFSGFSVANVVDKYYDNPIIISFQPQETSVSQIPFPAVTICNVNVLKATVMREVFEDLKLQLRKTNHTYSLEVEESIVLNEYLAHHCLAAPSFRRLLEEPLIDANGEADFVQDLSDFLTTNYAITERISPDAFEEMYKEKTMNFTRTASPHCADMVLKCMWDNKFIECKNFFFPVSTQHGSCCAFNLMPRFILKNLSANESRVKQEMEDLPDGAIKEWKQFEEEDLIQNISASYKTKYPKHQKTGGKPYGLSILINPETDMYSTCTTNDAWGFKVLAHSPISFPTMMDYGVAVPPNSEVFINIEPEVTVAEARLKSVKKKKRGCYLPDDRGAQLKTYKFYTADNCKDECIADRTYERCHCVRYFMPRNETQKMCGARLLDCAEKVRSMLEVGAAGKANYCGRCLPACTEIRYKMQMSYFPLRKNNASVFFYNSSLDDIRNVSDYSIVHIYLGTDSLYAKERKRLYDWPDLLASAGGLLSLTLGFSIISVIEAVYFFTLRVWFHFRSGGNDLHKSSSRSNEIMTLSTVVRTRKTNQIHNESMTDYYNWLSTTSVVTKQLAVAPAKRSLKQRQTPDFQLLTNPTQSGYSFVS